MRIAELIAWEALDSRGRPTVACEVVLDDGTRAHALAPSGASTGSHEAHELRDGGARYEGYGVRTAVANVEGELAAAVAGLDVRDQQAIDAALEAADGSARLDRLGANAVLAVSVAAAAVAATATGEPLFRAAARDGDAPLLPLPMVNIVSGGQHAGWSIDIQDILVVPVGAGSFTEAIEWAGRVRRGTAAVARARGHDTALVADEGGLGLGLGSNRAALDLVCRGAEAAGLRLGDDVALAIDVAATQLVGADGRYRLRRDERILTGEELVAELADWCTRYPIVSIEDPLAEDDWDAWAVASARLGEVQLLGDDLFATNTDRLKRGIRAGVANAVLVKPNQAGTLSRALAVARRAEANGYARVLSARSGETEDAWLADLAVAWRTGQIKVGSTMRSERTAKWNRLLQIERVLGERCAFAGRSALAEGSLRPSRTG